MLAKRLGWLWNFNIAFKVGWEIRSTNGIILRNPGILRLYTSLQKNSFNILVFSISSVTTDSPSTKVTFSEILCCLTEQALLCFKATYCQQFLICLSWCSNLILFFVKELCNSFVVCYKLEYFPKHIFETRIHIQTQVQLKTTLTYLHR